MLEHQLNEFEKRIVAVARGRLLANTREFKELPGLGVVSIGCLARLIHLQQVPTVYKSIELAQLKAAIVRSTIKDRRKEDYEFAELTLHAPILLYAEADDCLHLIDGHMRMRALEANGSRSVDVAIIERETVKRFRIADPIRDDYETLKTLEPLPIGAQGPGFKHATVVQMSADHGDLSRGGQDLEEHTKQLRTYHYYFMSCLFDIEYYIYKTDQAKPMYDDSEAGLDRRSWLDWFARRLWRKRFSALPSLNLSTIANNAGPATAELTAFKGRLQFKRISEEDWSKMDQDSLGQERDLMAEISIMIYKAFVRHRGSPAMQRKMVEREFDDSPPTKKQIEAIVNSQAYLEATKLDLGEQLLVTRLTGVNVGRVYSEFTDFDPLFEAHRFEYLFKYFEHAEVDAGMIETAIHRRALAILGQRDASTAHWEDLFVLWADVGIGDREMLHVLTKVDRGLGHYAATKIDM